MTLSSFFGNSLRNSLSLNLRESKLAKKNLHAEDGLAGKMYGEMYEVRLSRRAVKYYNRVGSATPMSSRTLRFLSF